MRDTARDPRSKIFDEIPTYLEVGKHTISIYHSRYDENIDEMARLAHNLVIILRRCLSDFNETPILIPSYIWDREKKGGGLPTTATDHGCVHNWSGRQNQIDSTQIGGNSRGLGL